MFWKFIVDGKYRNKATNGNTPQFYRFDKPEDDKFPKMIELFCRSDFELKSAEGITPIHINGKGRCQKRECDLAETLEACSSVQVSSFIYICINRLESCNIDQCIKCTSDPQRYCNDSPDRIVGTQNIHTESLDSQSFSKLRNQVCKNIVKDGFHN